MEKSKSEGKEVKEELEGNGIPEFLKIEEPAGEENKAKYWLMRGLPDEEVAQKGINKNTVRIARSHLARDGFLLKEGKHYTVMAGPKKGVSLVLHSKPAQLHDVEPSTEVRQKLSNIYFIVDDRNKAIKIGASSDPTKRILGIQTHNPNKLELVGIINSAPVGLERNLHEEFKDSKLSGEWFRYYSPGDNILLRIDGNLVRYTIPHIENVVTLTNDNAEVQNGRKW